MVKVHLLEDQHGYQFLDHCWHWVFGVLKTITKAVEKKDLEMMFNTDEEVMENMWMTADLTPEVPAQVGKFLKYF